MPEVIYIYEPNHVEILKPSDGTVRWLANDELDVFNGHLLLCEQGPASLELWHSIEKEGTSYCGCFVGGNMVARAAVEKYSPDKWEVADVRVARPYRNRGYAKAVCTFVMDYIIAHGRTPTIRTEDYNEPMKKVIASLGFFTN